MSTAQASTLLLRIASASNARALARIIVANFIATRMEAVGRNAEGFARWWNSVEEVCKLDCFYGCLTRQQLDMAENWLRNPHMPIGSYFVYFSHGQPGMLTISYLDPEHEVRGERCANEADYICALNALGLNCAQAVPRRSCVDVFPKPFVRAGNAI